ncbi:hypothetical protein CEP54_006473 [Fusarium duplospermum]|uniref:Uncharacterized protein n=1 Tax=Fusarium duplospermum TaxID=1325734 RepID=A0A428Q6V2_9HYPO|nr:hypothetical protein CEP54_006473 [Fusarium duplospermum]
MVSQPIRDGSGKSVMLDQKLYLEENSVHDDADIVSTTLDLPGREDSERQDWAHRGNLQSPEMETIIFAIETAYANGSITREDVQDMFASQLEAQWLMIRDFLPYRALARNQPHFGRADAFDTSLVAATFAAT